MAPQPKSPLGRWVTAMGPSIRPRPSSPRSPRVGGWRADGEDKAQPPGFHPAQATGPLPTPASATPRGAPPAQGQCPRCRRGQWPHKQTSPLGGPGSRPLALGVWTGPGGARAGAAFVPVLGRGPVCQPLLGAQQGAAWILPCSPGMPTGAPSLRRCFANSTAHMSGNRPVAPAVNSLTQI